MVTFFVMMTVDGVDCHLQEPYPFSREWCSHKFHSSGLRYEISLSIFTGTIVWINGPYPCGSYPDVKIFRDELKGNLIDSENVLADKGYKDHKCVLWDSKLGKRNSSLLPARHETINGRFKFFLMYFVQISVMRLTSILSVFMQLGTYFKLL